jgi:hypothetical protein
MHEPVHAWHGGGSMPDARTPGFAEECRQQTQSVNQSAGECETLEFIEQIADWRE